MSKPYPECGYLGSDVAELGAFAAGLKLKQRLTEEGHTSACASLQVFDNRSCICRIGKEQTK